MVVFLVAAELGFEPRHTESESAVLPLHNSAISTPTCRWLVEDLAHAHYRYKLATLLEAVNYFTT